MFKKLPILILALAVFCLPLTAGSVGASLATADCAELNVNTNNTKSITLTLMKARDPSRQVRVPLPVSSTAWCGKLGDDLDTLAVSMPATPTDTRSTLRFYDLAFFRRGGKAAITYKPDNKELSVTVDGNAVPVKK